MSETWISLKIFTANSTILPLLLTIQDFIVRANQLNIPCPDAPELNKLCNQLTILREDGRENRDRCRTIEDDTCIKFYEQLRRDLHLIAKDIKRIVLALGTNFTPLQYELDHILINCTIILTELPE